MIKFFENYGFGYFIDFCEVNECFFFVIFFLNYSFLDEIRCSRIIKFYLGMFINYIIFFFFLVFNDYKNKYFYLKCVNLFFEDEFVLILE